MGGKKGGGGKGGAITEIGREDGEDPMRSYQGLTADQLRAQVEVLLDSVASWEQRVSGCLRMWIPRSCSRLYST